MSELAMKQHYSAVRQRLMGKPSPTVNVAIAAKNERERAEAEKIRQRARQARWVPKPTAPDRSFEQSQEYLAARADELGFTVDDMVGYDRDFRMVAARHLIMWEVRQKFQGMSFPKIGWLFGGRDSSTIQSAIRRVQIRKDLG